MVIEELGEQIIGVMEIEVMEYVSFGAVEAIHVIGSPLLGV